MCEGEDRGLNRAAAVSETRCSLRRRAAATCAVKAAHGHARSGSSAFEILWWESNSRFLRFYLRAIFLKSRVLGVLFHMK